MSAHPFSCPRVINLFITLVLLSNTPLAVADPPRHPMDDEDMQQMMNERGYGGGYGYNRGGNFMGPMGNMMGPMGPMGPMGSMMGNMMGDLGGLNLTDKQRNEVREIFRNMRKRHWNLMDEMMETSDKLYKLYDVDKPDPEKIGKVYDEIYKVKRQMIQEHIEIRNKIYDLLTKEQREKYKASEPYAHRYGMMF